MASGTNSWSLSERSKRIPVDWEYTKNYSVWTALQNPFHERENPEGIINFGTAVSGLMDDVWHHRFMDRPAFTPDPSHYRYYRFWGSDSFRKALAAFLTPFFKPRAPIVMENLFVLNGALASLDILGFLLADEGDSFLFLTPCYSSYYSAGKQRWGLNMVEVPLTFSEKSGEEFELSLASVEKAISDEETKGRRVKAFIFNNPENPTGKVFSKTLVEEIMRLCQRRQIHLIADEMYCMSVFDKASDFQSVLQVHTPDLLESNFLHVIWGFSKDLCLTSYRTGVIHTQNQDLQNALMSTSQFQAVPLPVMHILERVISDIDWFRTHFVPKNHTRLLQAYETCKKFFDSLGFRTTSTSAGFFFLVDFRPLFNPLSKDASKDFIQKLYTHKLYMTPSWEMGAPEGWFRFIFTAYTENGLHTGLARLKDAIAEWKEEKGL